MFRIKDPVKSLEFYRDVLGMTLLGESHYGDFSNYFLAQASQNDVIAQAVKDGNLPDPKTPEAKEFMKRMFGPVIELTHNHGTENNSDFKYVIHCYALFLLLYSHFYSGNLYNESIIYSETLYYLI
jgi:lactoylglutathione lyase